MVSNLNYIATKVSNLDRIGSGNWLSFLGSKSLTKWKFTKSYDGHTASPGQLSQISNAIGSTSIKYLSDTSVSDRYLIDVDPRVQDYEDIVVDPTSLKLARSMMTSSNGNIFRVTGHLCGEFTGEFPVQRPVTRSFDVFFDLRLYNRLSKQSWGWWFETPSRTLWRHFNGVSYHCFSREVLWNEAPIYRRPIQLIEPWMFNRPHYEWPWHDSNHFSTWWQTWYSVPSIAALINMINNDRASPPASQRIINED